jgi:hypothetical protein
MSEYTTGTVSSHCDICGESKMTTSLRDSYATKDIKYICWECLTFTDEHLDKLRSISHSWVSKALKLFLRTKRKHITKRTPPK